MDLKDKIAVVIGGTSGIGRATALMMARQGADVTIVGRDQVRGTEAEAALKTASGGKGAFIQADLSLLSECRRVVNTLDERLPRLDALVQSAGGVDFEAVTTSEGLNKLFVGNFLSRLVIAKGLKDKLAQAKGRMVCVNADLSDTQEPDWANFEGKQSYAGVPALPKLHTAGISSVQYLAGVWKADGIEVTSIHPGLVDTGFFRSAKGPWKLVAGIIKLFVTSPDIPAGLLCWLAFSDEAKGLSGYFFPSPKDHSKRRLIQRPEAAVARVMKVAEAAIARVPA